MSYSYFTKLHKKIDGCMLLGAAVIGAATLFAAGGSPLAFAESAESAESTPNAGSEKATPGSSVRMEELSGLERAERHFSNGSFEKAAEDLNPLLVDDSALGRAEKSRLYLLKARLDLAFGNDSNLDIWLGRAFKSDPSLNLDPLNDPPLLVTRWTELKRRAAAAPKDLTILPKQKPGQAEVAGVDSTGKSFAAGLMPFGLAQLNAGRHKDAALFFSASLLPLVIAQDLPAPEDAPGGWITPRRPEFFGGIALLGVYGYQLLDMSTELFDRNPTTAQTVYAGLSLAPFGVGQLRNDEPMKALAFALVEGTALAIAGFSDNEQHRNAAFAVFSGAAVIGAADATMGFRAATLQKRAGQRFHVWPLFAHTNRAAVGVGLKLSR